MPYGSVFGNQRPSETGSNFSEIEIILVAGNTLDSVTSDDPVDFVLAKTNVAPFYPSPIYNTGKWSLGSSAIEATLVSVMPRTSKIIVSGTISSDSTVNSGHVAVRLRDTDSVMTGTSKQYSAGATAGGNTVEIGFTVIGFTTITSGKVISMEVAKDFSGTLVVESILMEIEPVF